MNFMMYCGTFFPLLSAYACLLKLLGAPEKYGTAAMVLLVVLILAQLLISGMCAWYWRFAALVAREGALLEEIHRLQRIYGRDGKVPAEFLARVEKLRAKFRFHERMYACTVNPVARVLRIQPLVAP